MARIEIPEGEGGEARMVWGLRPEMAPAIAGLIDAAYNRSNLHVREREAARIRIAQLNQCPI